MSARKESQQNIFTVLSSLYNYFGADSSVQLTIANVPIPDEEIGNKRFFPESGQDTARYAREYNQILNDKMREGVSNLTRHRYLPYMVGAADVDEAVPKLARIKEIRLRIVAEAHVHHRHTLGLLGQFLLHACRLIGHGLQFRLRLRKLCLRGLFVRLLCLHVFGLGLQL